MRRAGTERQRILYVFQDVLCDDMLCGGTIVPVGGKGDRHLKATGKRVLVVDDDVEIQQLVRILLSRIGAEAISAGNVAEAARVLRNPPLPDMLILDLMLPDVSGQEFLKQLRAAQTFDSLPILVLSALADTETIRTALNYGADRYLTKPYIANNLISIAQDMLKNGRAVRPQAGAASRGGSSS